jgi:hypothetical protein
MLIQEPEIAVIGKLQQAGIETASLDVQAPGDTVRDPDLCGAIGIRFRAEIHDCYSVGESCQDALDRGLVTENEDGAECVASVNGSLKRPLKPRNVYGGAQCKRVGHIVEGYAGMNLVSGPEQRLQRSKVILFQGVHSAIRSRGDRYPGPDPYP